MKEPTNTELLSEACQILAFEFEQAKRDKNPQLAKELLRAWNKIQRVRRGKIKTKN